MRFLLAALFASLTFTATAQAAELTVLAPGFVKNAGIDDLAAAYGKETGVKVTVNSVGMGAKMDTIGPARRQPMTYAPRNLMDQWPGRAAWWRAAARNWAGCRS